METRRHEDCAFLPHGRGHPERPEAETIIVFRNLSETGADHRARTDCFDRDCLSCRRWRRAVARNSARVEELFGVKPRRKHRTGSAQRTRVAGRDLPQHDRPWLTAFDGGADFGFGRKEQRDKGGPRPFTRRRTFDPSPSRAILAIWTLWRFVVRAAE